MATIFGKFGPGRSESITGTAQNDEINPLGGNDIVDGGRGFDTVIVEAGSSDFKISTLNGVTYLDTSTGASSGIGVTLRNVESVRFKDRTVSLEIADRLINSPAAEFSDAGPGLDTFVYAAARSLFRITADYASATVGVSRPDGREASDFLTNIERLEFAGGQRVALDLGAGESAGTAVLLIGAVIGRAAMMSKPELMGTVIGLLDQGLSAPVLGGALLRLPIWGGVLTPTNSHEDIARHLLTVVNQQAPSEAAVASAAAALRSETPQSQGTWLADLALSAANQTQVNLVGLKAAGFDYLVAASG